MSERLTYADCRGCVHHEGPASANVQWWDEHCRLTPGSSTSEEHEHTRIAVNGPTCAFQPKQQK